VHQEESAEDQNSCTDHPFSIFARAAHTLWPAITRVTTHGRCVVLEEHIWLSMIPLTL